MMNTEKRISIFTVAFIMRPCRERFTAGTQGTHCNKSIPVQF